MSKQRVPRLLAALESRLEALTEGLEQVDVTGKGIELIKEIKELHAILHNLQEDDTTRTGKTPPPLTVVWGGMPGASSVMPCPASNTRPSSSAEKTGSKAVRASGRGSASTRKRSPLVQTTTDTSTAARKGPHASKESHD